MPGTGWRGIFLLALWFVVQAQPGLCKAKPHISKHVLKRNETLVTVAKTYDVSVEALLSLNRIKDPGRVGVGRILYIPRQSGIIDPEPDPYTSPSRKTRPKSPPRIETERYPESSLETLGALGLSWPLEGEVSSGYGPRHGRIHSGIDIAAPTGRIIASAESGEVVKAGGGWQKYGNVVLVDHGNGYCTLYAHCARVFVKIGQKIEKGRAIAAVGSTGNATGPHLHFEIWKDGNTLNPLKYLPRSDSMMASR